MHKLNFLCLIANAIFFITLAFTNVSYSQNPAAFNPNSAEYEGKIVVAKTFATWCRYCRQKALNEIQIKQLPQGEESMENNKIVNLVLVPTENYEESTQFFDDIGFKAKVLIIDSQQLEDLGVNNFGAILVFNNNQLVRMFDGEVELVSSPLIH